MSDTTDDEQPANPMTAAQKAANKPLPKRFYTSATVAPCEGGFEVLLDGRRVRTPARRPLVVPRRPLAELVAAEWEGQGGEINPATMPLTRLANSALDGVVDNADAVRADVGAFAGNDLVCYRADTPDGLVARQREHWDPVLAWADAALGAHLVPVTGVLHHKQSAEALDRIAVCIARFDPLTLAALHSATSLTGSALLALALADGALTPDAAWTAAHVDEDWQADHWGHDTEAERRRAHRRRDFDAAATVLRLARA